MIEQEFRARVRRFAFASLGISGAAERQWTRMQADGESAPSLVRDGEIMLYGPMVDEFEASCFNELVDNDMMTSSQQFMARLNTVEGDVTVRINSPGGSVFEAASIHAALVERRNSGDKVTIKVDGMAASAATFVMLAGSEVLIAEMGNMMVHRAWLWMAGNADDLRAAAADMDAMDKDYIAMLNTRLGKTEDETMELLRAETWFTATQAVEAGLADGKTELKKPKSAPKAQTNAARNARFRAMLALEA